MADMSMAFVIMDVATVAVIVSVVIHSKQFYLQARYWEGARIA